MRGCRGFRSAAFSRLQSHVKESGSSCEMVSGCSFCFATIGRSNYESRNATWNGCRRSSCGTKSGSNSYFETRNDCRDYPSSELPLLLHAAAAHCVRKYPP